MENPKNHLLSNCVFCRVARPTSRYAICRYIPDRVVHPVNSVIYVLSMCVFWGLDMVRRSIAIEAILRCYFQKLFDAESKFKTAITGIPNVILVKSIFGISAISDAGMGVSGIGGFPSGLAKTAARLCCTRLKAAKANWLDFSARAFCGNPVVVWIFRVPVCDAKNGHIPVHLSNIFGAGIGVNWVHIG